MTCVFPVCRKDSTDLLRLLRWVARLGGTGGHNAVIVADSDTPYRDVLDAQGLCKAMFDVTHVLTTQESTQGWPAGSNALFKLACQECTCGPWLWCEADCVPIKATWLDDIAAAYIAGGKPFMGHVYQTNNPKFPATVLSGIAVYPANAFDYLSPFLDGQKAWDVAAASVIVHLAHHSPTIQHFWGQPGLPPTFAHAKTPRSPVNTFTLANLQPGAVLFHRNKDGTLIALLGGEPVPCSDLLVVFPFCNKDGDMALKNMRWIHELGRKYDYDVLLCYEDRTEPRWVNGIRSEATACFSRVFEHCYPQPINYPAGPNWAFKQTAMHVCGVHKRPWLWMEFDAIPLKPDWIAVLDSEYRRCGKPFFGPVVPGLGHVNGTCVYPANALDVFPRMMANHEAAGWDVQMRDEMIGLCADASHVYQHAWGVERNRLHPYRGNAPTFRGIGDLRWLNRESVIFHRCKDGSLIDQLRKQNHSIQR